VEKCFRGGKTTRRFKSDRFAKDLRIQKPNDRGGARKQVIEKNSLRWKASRVVDGRSLHGLAQEAIFGSVDESIISHEKADFRQIDRVARGSMIRFVTRKKTPRFDFE